MLRYIFQVSLLAVKTVLEECVSFILKNPHICTNEDRTPQLDMADQLRGSKG